MINNEIFKRDIPEQNPVPEWVLKRLRHLQAKICSSTLEKCAASVSSPCALQASPLPCALQEESEGIIFATGGEPSPAEPQSNGKNPGQTVLERKESPGSGRSRLSDKPKTLQSWRPKPLMLWGVMLRAPTNRNGVLHQLRAPLWQGSGSALTCQVCDHSYTHLMLSSLAEAGPTQKRNFEL